MWENMSLPEKCKNVMTYMWCKDLPELNSLSARIWMVTSQISPAVQWVESSCLFQWTPARYWQRDCTCGTSTVAEINASHWPHLRAIRSQPVSCPWLWCSRATPSACLPLFLTLRTWEGAINSRAASRRCAFLRSLYNLCLVQETFCLSSTACTGTSIYAVFAAIC